MTAKSEDRQNQEEDYELDERASGVFEIVRKNNNVEVEFEINIDKVIFEGFDRQLNPRMIEDTIRQRLTSYLSEHINLIGFRSQMIMNEGMNRTNRVENGQNFFSAAHLDGGSISLKSGKVDSPELADDAGRSIVRGLNSLKER